MRCGARLGSGEKGADWQATVPERLARALGSQFSVIGELGRGGFAVVYSVRDSKRGQYLAIKVMRPDLMPSGSMMERFRREAQFISQLDHPNILPVIFTGKEAGLVYYAMPRVRGPSLRGRLDAEGRLGVEEARRVFCEIAAGLGHAHEREVIHRDVKPANIMLENGKTVRIVDFGIAKAISSGTGGLTATGEIIGSAEYMSPEQAGGKRDIDHRSDIYALGIVGYETLIGEPPFRGTSFHDVMVKHFSDPAPDPRELRPEVPHSLARAVLRCLAKEPGDRWATATEAAQAALG
ncbi:MAG: serine/threonine-protein kinase [Gemmatimonadales bacterium]